MHDLARFRVSGSQTTILIWGKPLGMGSTHQQTPECYAKQMDFTSTEQ